MAFNFFYYAPTEVIFGRDTVSQVGDLVKKYGGKKVLFVYGSERIRANGLLDQIEESMKKAEIPYWLLGGVVPNPHIEKAREGMEIAKREGIDFFIGIGGGSAIDTAKAIAYGMTDPDLDVWELYDDKVKRIPSGCYPVAAILTIAAAGSETSNSSVLTNAATGEKRSYNSELARPKFAIMDPTFTLTLPDWQTESGCADMMMHTMERYFVQGDTMEITDTIAEALLRTVIKNAKILHSDPQNYDARAEVMWAGSLAHNGLTGCGIQAGDFACHLIEHELGGMFDVTHGAGLAAIWGTWARYVYKNCLPRFVRYAIEVMQVEPGATDEETALRGIEAMEDFYRSIGMPTCIRDLGIEPTDEQCREMAKGAMAAAGGKKGAAKVLYEEDVYQIYKAAL